MSAVTVVGDYAFAYTALTEADLSSATEIGTHAFMKETYTPFTVKLSASLVKIGVNPFAMCHLKPFSSTKVESFNGTDYEVVIHTFDISDTIKIVDGSLYRVVANGLEMIAYAGEGESATVAEDTVRISALAFAGSDVAKVVLPYTLKAIGHKAFYACENLTMVSFASYEAPILEEEYDYYYYVSGDNVPATGDYSFLDTDGVTVLEKPGIEIVPYFMWNASDLATNVFYGANFSDYIGHIEKHIVMVRPVNGQHYDSFIFDQYFSVSVDGAAAADDVTLEAIAAINKLPDTVGLAHKALVLQARAAYDKIASLEQRSLVKAYSKLTQAEKRISDLEYLANGEENAPEEPPVTEPEPQSGVDAAVVIAIVAGVVALLALSLAGVVLALYLKSRNGDPKDPTEPADESVPAAPAAEEGTAAENTEDSSDDGRGEE
jgi:hypothetical protein